MSWIKVKRYVDDPTLSWEERYAALEAHHLVETKFLINTILKLAGAWPDSEKYPFDSTYTSLTVELALENAAHELALVEMANRHGELVSRRHGHGDSLTPDEEAELDALTAQLDRIG